MLLNKHHLEERGATHVSLGLQHLHDVFKWQMLMGIALQAAGSHLAEQLSVARMRREIAAQYERIEEATDQAFQLATAAIGNGGPHRKIALPAVTCQQDLEGGQQGHKQGHSFAPRQFCQGIAQARRQLQTQRGPLKTWHCRARMIRWQVQGRQNCQMLNPVVQMGLQRLALEPLSLPESEVGILKRQRWQWGGLSLRVRVIECAQFLQEDLTRPGIRDDMVHRQHQHMALRCQTQQASTQQRTLSQGEWLADLDLTEMLGLHTRLLGQALHVYQHQRNLLPLSDLLHRLTINEREGSAQDLMTLDDLLQTALQGSQLEETIDAESQGDGIGGTAALKLIQEPEPLLGK